MLFNSLEFLIFFLVFFGLYVSLRHRLRAQNTLLLVASYLFYGAWDYRFLLLLAGTTVIDYFVGLALERQPDKQAKKKILIISLAANLGVLGFFKYFNFFEQSFIDLAAVFGMSLSPFILKIVLPVGISFYTFQSMSYTIDVYRGELKPVKDFRDFALFVAFFPQLIAGPIERATMLIPQIVAPRILSLERLGSGLCLIVFGFYKKVVLADNLSPTVDAIFNKSGGYTAEEVIVGVVFFAFQIYGDFSGYTDIARGLSRLLGFELMVNFRQPYFARNPSDFWRRWHISLSTWLRDYLYVPLGGNKGSRFKTYRNLMITMFLGGLWHGAAWNYIWWGVFHGLLLVGYRLYDESRGAHATRGVPTSNGTLRVATETALMFIFTLYSWMLFRAHSGTQIVEMTAALVNFESAGMLIGEMAKLVFYAWPLLLWDYFQFRSKDEEPLITRASIPWQAVCYAGLLLMFIILGQYEGASFIYFQF